MRLGKEGLVQKYIYSNKQYIIYYVIVKPEAYIEHFPKWVI